MGYTYYTYRADGLRHSVDDTVHIWDGTDIVADIDGDVSTVYFRGIGLIFSENAGVRTYYHQNAHGDVIMLTDGQGNIIKTYEYDAFGVEWDAVDTDNNPFRYCGEYFDKETKTVYLRARYYDSAYGRFTQEDPIKDGSNWYAYCDSNPINRIDPTGLTDVMVSYIAQKNGGDAYYSQKSFLWFKWDRKIVVTINGISHEYSVGAKDSVVRMVNGQCVIDSQILIEDFGLTEEEATHQVGDAFDTMNDAAIAWGLTYNGQSIDLNRELASAIYSDDGVYKYTTPVVGNIDSAPAPNSPKGKALAAIIHAHGAYDPRYDNENFSGRDGDKGVAVFHGVPIYVTTPGGSLKKYDPSKWLRKTTTLNHDMPYDSNQ